MIRAELPGVDPDADIEISVSDRTLHIRAERREESERKDKPGYRSEFRYGAFHWTSELSAGVTEDDVAATYKDGILEVRVKAPAEAKEAARKIQVQHT